MTNDKDRSIQNKPLTSIEPFHVVLIDVQKAANLEIQCVKKPLTKELKYVAISYRWGELQETNVNTGVGYLASITLFALDDFYQLCAAMTKDPSMTSIPYVWVDAICVNQSNYDERKATVYYMNEIYEYASWILAVPDLHAAHLKAMHFDVMGSIQQHQSYLYYLVHGNANQLRHEDQVFLDVIGVPQDSDLRQLLTEHTNCFADSFMHLRSERLVYDDDDKLAHLYDLHTTVEDPCCTMHANNDISVLHPNCDTQCPFTVRISDPKWHRKVIERRTAIHQAMRFFTNLIVDWSSRVWVISEFHISKKKNNLQWWFNQFRGDDLAFFKFDLTDPQLERIENHELVYRWVGGPQGTPVFYLFHGRLVNQLNRQTFLEMMLKSKASKNEDRFYSIFPLFSEYKHLIQNKALVTNINSMLYVKLKLYQVMNNEHKLLLLYFSAQGKTTWTLPTFATSVIDWSHFNNSVSFMSLVNHVDIQLHEKEGQSYLRWHTDKWCVVQNVNGVATNKVLAQLLQTDALDVAMIRYSVGIDAVYLIGSVDHNRWILGTKEAADWKPYFKPTSALSSEFTELYIY